MSPKLEKFNNKIIDSIYLSTAIFAIPIFYLTLSQFDLLENQIIKWVHGLLVLGILFIYFFRKKINFNVKFSFYFLLNFIVVLVGSFNFGIFGVWGFFGLAIAFLSALFIEKQISKVFLALLLVIVIISTLYQEFADNPVKVTLEEYEYLQQFWLLFALVFLYHSVNIFLALRIKRLYFLATIKDLEKAKKEVDKTEELEVAKQKLEEGESLYRLLFDNAHDAIFWADKDTGIILQCNKQAEVLMEASKNEIIGKHYTVLFSEQNKEEAKKRFNSHKNTSKPAIGNLIIKTQNGIERDVLISSSVTQVNNKEIVQGIFRDVTEKERMTRKLENATVLQESILNAFEEGIYMNDRDLNIVYANDAIVKRVGKNPVGEKCYKALYGFDSECRWCSFEKLKIQKKLEYILEKDKGKTILVKNKLLPNNTKLTIFHDITKLKKQETQLKKLSTIVDQNPASIVITDLNGNIEYVNKQFTLTTGYTEEEAIGENPRIIKSSNTKPEVYKTLWETISNGKVWEGEFLSVRKDNTEFWEKVLIGPIFDKQNIPISYVAIKQDITVQKEAQLKVEKQNKELQELNQVKDRLFSIIGHDLKNPFQSLLGFSDLLISKYDFYTDEKRLNFIKIINENAKKGINLLSDLLEWAKTQQNTKQFNPQPTIFKNLATDVLSFISNFLIEKNIDIIDQFSVENFIVDADYNMIKTVIRNLVSNAIKFTADGGTITLNATQVDESTVEVEVKDSGIGMTHEQISNLFKLDKIQTTNGTRGEKGTGFGLILCKEFIEKHNQKIRVESKVGEGSSFIFSLALTKNTGMAGKNN